MEIRKEELQSGVHREAAKGMILVVLGTVCFAAKSIFVKVAYTEGASPEATLLLRQLIATPLFWLLFWVYRPKTPLFSQKREIAKASLTGFLGFLVSPLLDFMGLHYVSAIVERMLVISYPVFVLLLSAILNKRMISISNMVMIVIVYIGIFLSIGGWNTSLLQANFFGAILIIFSSVLYAGYLVMSGQLVHKIGGLTMNAFGMTVASIGMVLYLLIRTSFGSSYNLFQYSLSVYGFVFAVAIVSTVMSFLMIVEGIKRIGAERASILSMMGPVLTIILGVLFLGEHLEPIQWVGCFLVFLAVALMEWQKVRGN